MRDPEQSCPTCGSTEVGLVKIKTPDEIRYLEKLIHTPGCSAARPVVTSPPSKGGPPNRKFTSPVYERACQLAKIKPSKRQASKWRNEQGLARQFMHQAIRELAAESKASKVGV